MTAIGKIILFFTSWAPAYAMVGLIAWHHHPRVAIACGGLVLASVILYALMECIIFGRAPKSLRVKSIAPRNENIFMYVVAYLPPFFAVDPSNHGQLAALVLFYVVFAITYVTLDLYYMNPMFIFRLYRTYTITSDSGEEYVALIKGDKKPVAGETIKYRGRDHILLLVNE
jgi:hypothetical protein